MGFEVKHHRSTERRHVCHAALTRVELRRWDFIIGSFDDRTQRGSSRANCSSTRNITAQGTSIVEFLAVLLKLFAP